MKISEPLIHELLELTRLFAHLPYNSIFMFVAYEDKRTFDFFDKNIYIPMTEGRTDYGSNVDAVLREIRNELWKQVAHIS
jgi:hypothetical protein